MAYFSPLFSVNIDRFIIPLIRYNFIYYYHFFIIFIFFFLISQIQYEFYLFLYVLRLNES
ncbi:hypothetical protein D6T70_00170 [Kurthia gibsonii]|nr:hypothetical protein D6T70_00170 [Kurthia gibsonii]